MKDVLKFVGLSALSFGLIGKQRAFDTRENKDVVDVIKAQHYGNFVNEYMGKGNFANCDYRYERQLACYNSKQPENLEVDQELTAQFINAAYTHTKLETEKTLQDMTVKNVIGSAILGTVLGIGVTAGIRKVRDDITASLLKFRDSRVNYKPRFDSNAKPFFSESVPRQRLVEKFCCPITCAIMKYPVTASDGKNYERAALMDRIQKGNYSSPTFIHENLKKISQHKWFTFNKGLSEEITKYLKQEEMLARVRQERMDKSTRAPSENRHQFRR